MSGAGGMILTRGNLVLYSDNNLFCYHFLSRKYRMNYLGSNPFLHGHNVASVHSLCLYIYIYIYIYIYNVCVCVCVCSSSSRPL
jgi:hypothetical protein